MIENKLNRIFLCHASEDKQQALSIYERLQTAGFNPWLDKKDLLPGQEWQREISRAIKNSRIVIIFFSRHSVYKRGYVQREMKLALDTLDEIPKNQIFVIPVRLDECDIPEDFLHIHYIDLFETGGFEKVVKIIESEIGQQNQFMDPRDGRVYKTIELFGKIWLANNLAFDIGEGSWFYANDPNIGMTYGRLYMWQAAAKACPPGWRLPTDLDWKGLAINFGGYHDPANSKYMDEPEMAYQALLEGGRSGFNANLGGVLNSYGNFDHIGLIGRYWSGTERDDKVAWNYVFNGRSRILKRGYDDKSAGYSCRCLRNAAPNIFERLTQEAKIHKVSQNETNDSE